MAYTVTKLWRGKPPTEHRVYLREEADATGLRYVPWREVERVGQYVLTDDGFVTECVKLQPMQKGRAACCVIATGNYAMVTGGKNSKLRLKRDSRYWVKQKMSRAGVRAALDIYVSRLATGQAINYDELGRMIQPTARVPRATFKVLARQPEVKKYVRQELEKRFTHSGFTVETVLEEFKTLLQLAKDNKSMEVLRDTVFKMAEMLEMVPDKRVTRFSYQQTMQLPAPEPVPDKEIQSMNQMLEAEYTRDADA